MSYSTGKILAIASGVIVGSVALSFGVAAASGPKPTTDHQVVSEDPSASELDIVASELHEDFPHEWLNADTLDNVCGGLALNDHLTHEEAVLTVASDMYRQSIDEGRTGSMTAFKEFVASADEHWC